LFGQQAAPAPTGARAPSAANPTASLQSIMSNPQVMQQALQQALGALGGTIPTQPPPAATPPSTTQMSPTTLAPQPDDLAMSEEEMIQEAIRMSMEDEPSK